MRGQVRRGPREESARTILWYTKWATHQAPKFPSVSRARIATLLDDMEARFQRNGASLRPVFQHRYYAARELGDVDDARTHWHRWWTEPRDMHADCVACEHAAHTWWALARHDDAGAVDATEDLIKRRLACAEIPHTLYASTLPALLRLGRVDDAIAFHRTGLRMLATLEHNVSDDVSTHAAFLALTNNLTTAVRVMNRALPRAAEHKQPSTRARVLTDVSVLCAQLRKAKRTRAQLDVAALLAMQSAQLDVDTKGRVDVAALEALAWTEANKIAALYDKRNGNRSFTGALERKRALLEHAVDAPLTKRKSASDDD